MGAVKPLQLSGNLTRNWLLFKQQLEFFLLATPSDSTTGDDALDVYNNLVLTEGENEGDLVGKFDE